MWGSIISAGAALAGGLLNRSSTQDANAANAQQAALNRQTQIDFAKKGIRWRVADAEKAGIHPLYALGAQTSSYAPVTAGQVADSSMGSAIASAGQDVSRAMNATRTQPEREAAFAKTVQDLSLTKMGLENELLATQVAKLKTALNPPMPSAGSNASEFKNPGDTLMFGGNKWPTAADTSNVEDHTKRYGEPAEWFMALPTALRDAKHNNLDAMSVLTAAYRWLDKHANPQFGNQLLERITKGAR